MQVVDFVVYRDHDRNHSVLFQMAIGGRDGGYIVAVHGDSMAYSENAGKQVLEERLSGTCVGTARVHAIDMVVTPRLVVSESGHSRSYVTSSSIHGVCYKCHLHAQ